MNPPPIRSRLMVVRTLLHCVAVSLAMNVSVWACPTDAEPRAAGTVLTVQLPGHTARSLSTTALAAWPQTTVTHSQSVGSSGSGTTERAVVYTGVLLRDVLANSGFASATDRSARTSFVEAVATDGYRAVFSWGELFNSQVGEQAVIIAAQGGKPLDVAVGPLALRSLADWRPGPRHVRNLCALIVRRL